MLQDPIIALYLLIAAFLFAVGCIAIGVYKDYKNSNRYRISQLHNLRRYN